MQEVRICIIGLGYVGLPLAVEFAKHFDVVGYDISESRISELASSFDRTREVSTEDLHRSTRLHLTSDSGAISDANVFVITVPTPVDQHKRPDLTPLAVASRTVGRVMRPGTTVIYESTVYPGATEEFCVPILEQASGMRLNQGFSVGYSPERINPGDQNHRLATIRKVTSGSSVEAAMFVDRLYSKIVAAGTHMAPTIQVAEAAKVIENTQRDVNIALINELAILFGRLGLDTHDVLEAAGTKWNFLPFQPGLVGGHCIGVDPYYLTHKAEAIGYHPQMILAGRRINDGMGAYVADQVVLQLAQRELPVGGARALVLGFTFKEDVPDLRNTRVIDIVMRLRAYGIGVEIVDPLADRAEARREYGIELLEAGSASGPYDAVIHAVGHADYPGLRPISQLIRAGGVVYDVKGTLPPGLATGRL